MVFDPSKWPIDCLSQCGSNEYVKDTANPNWRSVKARLDDLESGQNRPLSKEDTEWWVDPDASNASDDNPGTQAEPWETLEKALDMLQSFTWVHNCVLHWRGAHTLPWYYSTLIRIERKKVITIDGGDELTVLENPVVSDISGQIGGNWRQIGNSGLALTVNTHKGAMIKLGNLGPVPGPLTGEKRTIIGNTINTYSVAYPFSGDPLGYSFEIVVPASSLTVNGVNGFSPDWFSQQTGGGWWGLTGRGRLYIQRCIFQGNIPVSVATGTAATGFHFASCIFDKPQAPGFVPMNLIRLRFFQAQSTHGCLHEVRDISDITGETLLAFDKCGVGSVGGDRSIFFYDLFNEGSTIFCDVFGSFFNSVTENSSEGHSPRIRFYSHVDILEALNTKMSPPALIYDCSIGGFIPGNFGPPIPAPSRPGIWLADSGISIGDNVDISNSTDGIYGRRSKIRFEGQGITGANNVFGVTVIDGSVVYYEPTAVVALSGPGGDVSLDGLVAVPGGHAAILGGTVFRDLITACVARIQSLFGV